MFTTNVGMRPAEPCTVSVVATHQVLTIILICLMRQVLSLSFCQANNICCLQLTLIFIGMQVQIRHLENASGHHYLPDDIFYLEEQNRFTSNFSLHFKPCVKCILNSGKTSTLLRILLASSEMEAKSPQKHQKSLDAAELTGHGMCWRFQLHGFCTCLPLSLRFYGGLFFDLFCLEQSHDFYCSDCIAWETVNCKHCRSALRQRLSYVEFALNLFLQCSFSSCRRLH